MNQEILKQQIKNYFNYMVGKNQWSNQSDQEFQNQLKNYTVNSFLDLDDILQNINFRDMNIDEFSDDTIESVYFNAINELLSDAQNLAIFEDKNFSKSCKILIVKKYKERKYKVIKNFFEKQEYQKTQKEFFDKSKKDFENHFEKINEFQKQELKEFLKTQQYTRRSRATKQKIKKELALIFGLNCDNLRNFLIEKLL
jgi:hypothetical protein